MLVEEREFTYELESDDLDGVVSAFATAIPGGRRLREKLSAHYYLDIPHSPYERNRVVLVLAKDGAVIERFTWSPKHWRVGSDGDWHKLEGSEAVAVEDALDLFLAHDVSASLVKVRWSKRTDICGHRVKAALDVTVPFLASAPSITGSRSCYVELELLDESAPYGALEEVRHAAGIDVGLRRWAPSEIAVSKLERARRWPPCRVESPERWREHLDAVRDAGAGLLGLAAPAPVLRSP